MEEDDQEQRRRKVEAGRAKLAQFRQRKAKGDGTHPKKTTAKRKSTAVSAPVPEEEASTVAGPGGLPAQRPGAVQELDLEEELEATVLRGRGEDESGEQEELVGSELLQTQESCSETLSLQPPPALELEALRLSLSNMHTAQLELTQANLQREKETALVELRDMLNGRHAQELALAQSRQQLELEQAREQHARERAELALRCGQETAELKEKLQSEMERNAKMIEILKQDWESQRELCLANLREELSAKHQSELKDLQDQFRKELADQKTELEKIFQAKNQAECALQTLEAQHEEAVRQLREDLQAERCQCLEGLELKFREQEQEKQRELEDLRASYEELKAQSQEEIRRLWAQLEPAGPGRQHPSEPEEQLQAQAPCVEDLEGLKRDFVQRQQQEKAEHESELEQLRLYFEQRLREAEKSYQEDLTLLQQRLQEGTAHSLLDTGPASTFGEALEGEGNGHPSSLLQPESHELDDDVWETSLDVPEGLQLTGTPGCTGDQLVGLSDEPDQGLARVCLRCAQDTALEVEAEVKARVLSLETEHKVQLVLLQTELKEEMNFLKIENRNLHEKLQHEVGLRENLEKVKHSLIEDHLEELKRTKEKHQALKHELQEKEAEWTVMSEDQKRKAEEKLTLLLLELRERAESEKQSIIDKFELREAEMRQLQEQQATQILELEASLVEQQGRLRQLELGLVGDEATRCSQCGREPGAAGPSAVDGGWELAMLRLKEDYALQLRQAQNRFLEERKEITEKFSIEQDASLRAAQEQHAGELQLLQQRHQQQVLTLTAELEAKHQAQLAELKTSLESEHQALFDARVAELQTKHAAQVSALEAKHSSNLDALEACCLSEIQGIRDEHRHTLELLRADFEDQMRKKDSSYQASLVQELEKLQQKHDEERRLAQDGPGVETQSSSPGGGLTSPASELQPARQEEELQQLNGEQTRSLSQSREMHSSLQPEEDPQIQQLKNQILSLSHELEVRDSELEKLQQRRERENQEGTNLISMLKSDIDQSHGERRVLRDTLKRLLGLFGETLRAATAMRSRISERVGLCLDDEVLPSAQLGDAVPQAVPDLDNTWLGSELAVLDLDTTVPGSMEVSSLAELSSHVCESFFLSPDRTLDWDQPVKKVFQSLGLAVDGLLGMALDSSKQLEEARQLHSRFEKEFSCKNEETAQVVRKHQELLQRLDEESATKARLLLELHKAEGLIAGFREEQASLQEALGRRDTTEQALVEELESLRERLQQAARQVSLLQDENSALRRQKEAVAAEAQDREAGLPVTVAHKDSALRTEVASLAQEHLETRKQCEKDRSALLSQMRVLESELEEQLSRQQACAQQAEELTALRQQMESLDKHLRSQRQFMDEQAVEREHEREDFQQEIRRLEEQLRQAARLQPQGPRDSDQAQLGQEVELLQEKLKEQSYGLNELAMKKDLVDKRVATQEQEIQRLEEANAHSSKLVAQLQGELEQQRRIVQGLQQDREALQEQQMSHLLLVSSLQSRLDEAKCPMPAPGGHLEDPQGQLEAAQEVLQQRENEVLDLKDQLEKIKADMVNKDQEVLHLNLKQSHTATCIQELQEENARLMAAYDRSSEIEELKSIIENLHENQERLQKDKVEEIEQLHEVIEKLQRELSLVGPTGHEVSKGQAGSLQSELDGAVAHGALASELQAALAAKEALSQLLAEQEHGHSQALETLRQRLHDAEAAAATRLAELERSTALRETEAQGLASRIRECEARIADRELEIACLSRRRWAHSTQLEAILAAFARFRGALERQLLSTTDETPELQRLRTQCVRLSRQLQLLNQRFLRCQKDLGRQQQPRGPCHLRGEGCALAQSSWSEEPSGDQDLEQDMGSKVQSLASLGRGCDPQSPVAAELHPDKALVVFTDAGPLKCDNMLVLSARQEQLCSELLLVKAEGHHGSEAPVQDEEEPLGKYQLGKVDLITQVKQLQEKLNHLVHSMNYQSQSAEAGSSTSDGEEADGLCPPAASPADEATRDLVTWPGAQGPMGGVRQWRIPDGDLPGSPQASSCCSPSELGHAHVGAECLKNALRALDLSSWSSPELLRKDSSLEPQPGLPFTPCVDVLSQYSLDVSLQGGLSDLVSQASCPGLLGLPEISAPKKSPPIVDRGSSADQHLQRTSVEKDVEDFIITSLDAQEKSSSPPPELEGKSDGSGEGDSSGLGETLTQDLQSLAAACPAVPSPTSRKSCHCPAAMKEKDLHPQQVKALLQMVCDESHQILALSEFQAHPSALSKGEPRVPLEHFLWERHGVVDSASVLRGLPTPATQKHEQGQKSSGLNPDWKGEFLQVVPGACEQLQVPQSSSDAPCISSALWERLEKVVRDQGAAQESLEPPQPSERTRLLSEIQALRAQLRLTHLQNQEKLQQLCTALTSTEARGSRREHQLRRQVELLAYKVEQEKCIASDLQKTLNEEQEKASNIQKLLVVEQTTAKDLKSELRECRQENERLLQSLNDVQKEVLQLRSVLDGKEKELRAALLELESQRGRECSLQSRLEEERQRHLHTEGQSTKSLEELKASLDKQFARSNRLCVALKHEQMTKDNLQKELRIESSRCEALLAQERGRLSELQQSLEAERSRAQELTEALHHERLLTEQLSHRAQEVCALQETQAQQVLLRKLEEEQARVRELQTTLQKAQQQAMRTQQRLEAEAQRRYTELQKEKERELELQCQRSEHKMKQLQRMLGELQAEGAARPSAQSEQLHAQQQGLEKIRQQLLCAAGLLTSFINQTLDRTIHDWTSSNEKAVASLLCTLQELKSELTVPSSSPKKMAAGLHVQLVDVLLNDNESLRKALGTVAEEKAELCRAVSKLEKTLKHHLLKGCALSRPDKSMRKLDKTVLQMSSQHPESGVRAPALSEDADSGSLKMEKLYLHYLRAESFRKALIYQKKYLLLLIGGFQDSEQETLSMIAHLGVFPSKTDRRVSSRPFTKFRTAVRVVIAILRLRFLVKKWQEVGRRGALVPSRASRPEFLISRHQESPPESSESPPTRDVSSSHSRDPLPRASLRRRRERSEISLTVSQDPEHSLTEYIHHLEMIQQRLGGVPPDSTSKRSFRQKIKQ
ncbi:pericentrin isoform X4 [Sorex araneus]|uniref:pericentrin isoform X4 n=1 Tax=Sorex araneus TaxID=42254 RepID=UPI002433413D|nr:pericentrin isoform X4 [Sorex araneus]